MGYTKEERRKNMKTLQLLYASEDATLAKKLTRSFTSLIRTKSIQITWQEGDYCLALLSDDFLAEDRLYEQACKAFRQEKLIPILLRAVSVEGLPFTGITLLPRNGLPIASWTSRDEACLSIVQEIQSILKEQ